MYTRIILIITLLSAFTWHLQAQTRPYVCVGLGWQESSYIGLKVPTGPCMIGLAVAGGSSYAALTTDLSYHFGGRIRQDIPRPWFFRMPVTLSRTAAEDIGENGLYGLKAAFRIGYAWFPSPRIGLLLDIGPTWRLFEDGPWLNQPQRDPGIEPGFNLAIYLRI
ncbi:MAG: hypothetical protein K9I85_15675 [Saprospiraceae bacterium]|nr:hypothetical protein [Saprospiraceae bacterium]